MGKHEFNYAQAPLCPENLEWQVVPFRDLGATALQPGLMITGICGFRDFNRIEDGALDMVNAALSATVRLECATAAKERLADKLRVPKYDGRISGDAFVFPLDVDRVRQYPNASHMPDDNAVGLIILTSICLCRTLSGVGTVLREVAYYDAPGYFHRASDAIRRAFNGPIDIDQARAVAMAQEERVAASAATALEVVRNGLRHVYSGGLPEGGRR